MDEQTKNRVLYLLRYIKEHPFVERCLSEAQVEEVVRLQTEGGSANEIKVKDIYQNAEETRVFPYRHVVYFRYQDDGKPKDYISLVYSDDDFNILHTAWSDVPKKFKGILQYFMLENFQVCYTYESLFLNEAGRLGGGEEESVEEFFYI